MRVWLLYIRKSVVRDDTDLESPERQLYICKTRLELAETLPYSIEIYQDLDRSGSTEAGRPDWLRLKEQLSRPEVAGVISSSLDRLYRNVSEFLAFLNELERSKKVLITSKESLDTSGPLGRFVVTIFMALFEMEWRLTSARMIDMIEHKRRAQGRHWGVAPFGCDRDEAGQLVPSQRTFILNDEQRYYYDGLVECYRVYATGNYSYEQVAISLNLSGWRFYDRGFNTGEWNEDRVRGVVNRWRMYKGDLALGNPLKDNQVEWVSGGHQPILPIELCNAVGQILSERNRRVWNRVGENRRVYFLSGALYCHCCGQQLNGQYVTYRLYRHKSAKGSCRETWTKAEAIEAQVIEAITDLVQHPALLNDIAALSSQLDTTDHNLQAELDEVQRKLSRLEDLYLTEGGISKASYLQRRGDLLNQLANLDSRKSSNDLPAITEQVLSYLSFIADAEDKTKKALVSTVIQRLEVSDGQIKTLVPQDWAKPFFTSCSKWAGWESNPPETPSIIVWFINSSSKRTSEAILA